MKNKKFKMILAGILAAAVVVGTINTIPNFALKAVEVQPYERHELAAPNSEIDIAAGEKLVAATETKNLFIDTTTLDITVVDKDTNKKWTSRVENPSNAKDQSIINITYLSKDDKKVEWDAYTTVVQNKNYTLSQLENGVRAELRFESATKKPEELLPSYVEADYLKATFLDGIDQLVSSGEIEEKTGKNYKNILNTLYVKDRAKGGFRMKDSGSLPPTALKQLADMVEQLGYTSDMVRADNEAAGLDIQIPEVASFKIVMDVTLEGDDLVVNIPTYEATCSSDFYTLQNIEVLPNFGHASSADVKDGYALVPDGAGALFELNTYNGSYPQYSRPLYNNTRFDKLYERGQYPEELSMPVFGMTYGKDENSTHGYLGIIESGEELASVNVQLGTIDISGGGSVNNKAYSSVDVTQYSRVKLMGPYSDNDTRYLTTTGVIDMDYTVRYKLFDESVTYFDMAETYRNYLIEKEGLEVSYASEPKMYLDVVGALSIKDRFLGVPYDKTISMTNYEQLGMMADELGSMNLIMNYQNAFNGGEYNKLPRGAKLVSENGSEKELKNVMNTVTENGDEIFLGTNLMTVKDDSYLFNPKKHAAYNYDSKPTQIYKYHLATGKFSPEHDPYYLLSPKYFPDVVGRVLKGTAGMDNLYIGDVPNEYYANYNTAEIITPVEANQIIEGQLKVLDESKTLAFNNPNMNTLPYCDYAVNISRESSNYGTMYSTIPFRQLVMNGIVEYTTLDVNRSKEDLNYYLLQAVELGSYPKFTVSYTEEDILKDTQYTDYFGIAYDKVKPRMEALYNDYTAAFAEIGSTEISNHRLIQENVFETEYANGVKVITNYNNYSVKVGNQTVEATGFQIIK